jgi:hypothetical protein
MAIYHDLLAAGVPLDSHETDLYAKITPESTAIVQRYAHKTIVTRFVSQIDKQWWYDIPFAYLPAWDRKSR